MAALRADLHALAERGGRGEADLIFNERGVGYRMPRPGGGLHAY